MCNFDAKGYLTHKVKLAKRFSWSLIMLKFSAFLAVVLVFTLSVIAEGGAPLLYVPGQPWCALGYRSDSYGLGLASGFYGRGRVPKLLDEKCFALAVESAIETKRDSGGDCERAFAAGHAEGLIASHFGVGTACYVIGYQAGAALLNVGAREGDTRLVGTQCVAEYSRGRKDGESLVVAQPKLESRLGACYQVGYFDGTMFGVVGR
jgi:hypothetical protein